MNITQMTAVILSDIPWQRRYAEIGNAVKTVLDTQIDRDGEIGTTELVERLMPLELCRGEQIEARNELFTILMKLAKHDLAPYCHKGEPKAKKRFGKTVAPWIWHASREPADPRDTLLATIRAAIEAHDIETESADELRGLVGRIYRDVCRHDAR